MRPRGTPPVALVVEDEFIVRYAIAQELRSDNWHVLEAYSGESALAHLSGRIDVVFTDIQLIGRLNGWDVAHAFRASRPDMPIIYTSANAADPGRRVEDSLFFGKPYDPAAVVRACWQRLSVAG